MMPAILTSPPAILPPWPAEPLRAVGRAYREASGRGDDLMACLDAAETAFDLAGGRSEAPREEVEDMLHWIAREHGDWLFGPAQARIDGQRIAVPAHGDLFDPPGSVA